MSKIKILVVDDKEDNRYLLEKLLQGNGYDTVAAENGAEALDLALKSPPDMIVSDILMPIMDGFMLCREWKKNERLNTIPFIFYTATYTDPKDEEFAMSLGATRFIVKPEEPARFLEILKETLAEFKAGTIKPNEPVKIDDKIFTKEHSEALVRKLEDKITQARISEKKAKEYAAELEKTIEKQKKAEQDLLNSYANLRRVLEETVNSLSSALETRDPYTAGHQRRDAQLACAIAKEMDLSNDQIEGLRIASLLHDIGKMAVPAEILSKPTKLTTLEFDLIKVHPEVGFNIIKEIEFPWPIAQTVHQHHERLNGSGYPRKLKGDQIILEARILIVADVVEAMSSHRPYRPALGIGPALEEINKNRDLLYDSKVVDACLRLFNEKGFKFQ